MSWTLRLVTYDATLRRRGYAITPKTNYDCDGNCLNDSDQDGICDEFEVAGCTDSSACNYDSTPRDDDASARMRLPVRLRWQLLG